MALDRSTRSYLGSNSADGVVLGLDSEQPIGFYGVTTPVARQTVSAAATDAGTTQTLANSLRTALIALNLVA
jgi:predicted RNA-binding Zn ribbon-like protein